MTGIEVAEARVKPNLLYIDEVEDERLNFEGDAIHTHLFGEVLTLHPSADIDETVEEILNHEIDAFVTDFKLSDHAAIDYTGADLVRRVLAIRKGFPCFVRTSHEDDALAEASDVNLVYVKSNDSLFKRICIQVENYEREIEAARSEFEQLRELNEPTAAQIDRMVELDDLLEESQNGDQKTSSIMKENFLKTGSDLLAVTQRLIDDMQKKLEQNEQNS